MVLSASVMAQKDVLKYGMKTQWAADVDLTNPWPEYPRPQLERETFWKSLNGQWDYAIVKKDKGQPNKFDGKITVPFAVESELSGVKKLVGEEKHLWYKRSFEAPKLKDGERLTLNFGAVDWEAVVYVNGKEVGSHKGGFDAFEMDITDFLNTTGKQELTVRVWDPSDKGTQPRGKQVSDPFGIWYTPVTGIWQTVWLEKVPVTRITNLKITPDIDTRKLRVEVIGEGLSDKMSAEIIAYSKDDQIAKSTLKLNSNSTSLDIPNPRLWSPEDPFLYDLKVRLLDASGEEVDVVNSYFGMRKISLGKDANGVTKILLNNRPLFQFGLLDQGWWPDGLYTAPTEEAMLYDVKMTKEMGFNMIRKHVKVEPARYYYHCDRMGMLVWQDMPNGNYLHDLRIQAWEEDAVRPKESAVQYEAELKEMMDQFHSFPSILVWVPFNEGWGQYDLKRVTKWVTAYDPSRLIDSPSGWADRGVGDFIDIHLYPGPGMEPVEGARASVLGEFGGLGYPVKDHLWWDKKNWGYLTYHDEETYVKEFENLMKGLQGLVSAGLSAAVYTQTTDVEGEVNGLITYDREVVKVSPDKLKALIDPLYKDYWSARSILADSEVEPSHWQISTNASSANWMKPSFDDFEWETKAGPFSAYENPYMESSSEWVSDTFYARQSFDLASVPKKLYMRHYLPKAQVKIWLNGTMIMEMKDQGGRKRHYTDIDISQWAHLLQNGNNLIAVEVSKMDENASFDLGLYTGSQVSTTKNTTKIQESESAIHGGK